MSVDKEGRLGVEIDSYRDFTLSKELRSRYIQVAEAVDNCGDEMILDQFLEALKSEMGTTDLNKATRATLVDIIGNIIGWDEFFAYLHTSAGRDKFDPVSRALGRVSIQWREAKLDAAAAVEDEDEE